MLYDAQKERSGFASKEEHFEGKPREQWHPYDRKSGTGRGRGAPKEGHGKGNWGNPDEDVKGEEAESPSKQEEGVEGEEQKERG